MLISLSDSGTASFSAGDASNVDLSQDGAPKPTRTNRDESDKSAVDKSLASTADLQSRIVGVVMDSPTPYENILEGIPNSISDNAVVRASIRTVLGLYMRAFYSSVTTHYIQGAQAAEQDNGGLPALMLYSSADRIVSSSKVDTVVAGWQKKGLFVRARKWEDTPHVGHFRMYPDEYIGELQKFLEHLRLTKAKL